MDGVSITSASEVKFRIVALREASAAAALFFETSSWLSRRNILIGWEHEITQNVKFGAA